MSHTHIEWADLVWNPVVGCRAVSTGCDHCYAARFAVRMASHPNAMVQDAYHGLVNSRGRWTGELRFLPDRLFDQVRWPKRAKRIFTGSMSDLFHEGVPEWTLRAIMEVCARYPQHTFLMLTKRPRRVADLLRSGLSVPENVWLGVSVEDQAHLYRAFELIQAPGGHLKFVSLEPLLGPVLIPPALVSNPNGIRWVIAGCESGPGARAMERDWVLQILETCQRHRVPFFYKQAMEGGRLNHAPKLEGRTWKQFPGDVEIVPGEMEETHAEI